MANIRYTEYKDAEMALLDIFKGRKLIFGAYWYKMAALPGSRFGGTERDFSPDWASKTTFRLILTDSSPVC